MRMRLFITTTILILFGGGHVLPAVDLFVSPSGDDAWSGKLRHVT